MSAVDEAIGRGARTGDLSGRVVVVTGAASGIGAACRRLAAELGASVLGVDRLPPTADDAGAWLTVDVTDRDAALQVVRRCEDQFGRVDGLVNAAGVLTTEDWRNVTPSSFERQFAVNTYAAFRLMQTAAGPLIAAGDGSIVNLGSITAQVPRPDLAAYAASKAALVSLTKSVAAALGPAGVRVNTVLPGTIDTGMTRDVVHARAAVAHLEQDVIVKQWTDAIPLRRLGTPQEVAAVVCFLLSAASRYITGEALRVTGGDNC